MWNFFYNVNGERYMLKEIREDSDVSVKTLAEYLQVDRKTIYNWENKTTDIPSSMLIKLADYFHVSTDYLLGRSELNEYVLVKKEYINQLLSLAAAIKKDK